MLNLFTGFSPFSVCFSTIDGTAFCYEWMWGLSLRIPPLLRGYSMLQTAIHWTIRHAIHIPMLPNVFAKTQCLWNTLCKWKTLNSGIGGKIQKMTADTVIMLQYIWMWQNEYFYIQRQAWFKHRNNEDLMNFPRYISQCLTHVTFSIWRAFFFQLTVQCELFIINLHREELARMFISIY